MLCDYFVTGSGTGSVTGPYSLSDRHFYWTMTVTVTFNGPIFWAIWGDITRYQAILGRCREILGDIRRYWGNFCYVLGKANSSHTGSVTFLVNFVWPCQLRYVALNGRYRTISLTLRVISQHMAGTTKYGWNYTT